LIISMRMRGGDESGRGGPRMIFNFEFQAYDPMKFLDQVVVFRMVADPEPRNCIVFDVAQCPVVTSYSDRPDFVAD